jgi:hypothetical protein
MLDSVSAVLTTRYHMLRDADRTGFEVERFWGLPEDRYVSAFLDRRPYAERVQSKPGQQILSLSAEISRLYWMSVSPYISTLTLSCCCVISAKR